MAPTPEEVAKQAQIMNFDDASAAAVAQMQAESQQNTEGTPTQDDTIPGEQAAQQPDPDSTTPNGDEALATAEAAAQGLVQKDAELQKVSEQNRELSAIVSQLQVTVDQMSATNKEASIASVSAPEVDEQPTLNIQELMYDDAETAASKVQAFKDGIIGQSQKTIMKELEPLIVEARKAKENSEKADLIEYFSTIPQMADFKELLPEVENIIKNDAHLRSDPNIGSRYARAYIMAKGKSTVNTAAKANEPMTQEQFMELYATNPEFQTAVETARREKMKDGQGVPQFSASSGASSVSLNLPSKATNFDDVEALAKQMYGR